MRRILAIVVTAVTLAASGAAMAQPAGGGPGGGPGMGPGMGPGDMMEGRGPGMGPGMGGPGGDPSWMCESVNAYVAGILAFTEVRLGITDAQRPAWEHFATAARSAAEPISRLCAEHMSEGRPATLPERLERMEEGMNARLEAIRQVRPALTELYGALTPEQQQILDRMAMRHMGRFGQHHGRHGHGGRGPQGPGPRAPAPQGQ